MSLEDDIVECLTTHSIVEVEQGRSFPMSKSEALYTAKCLLAGPLKDLMRKDECNEIAI